MSEANMQGSGETIASVREVEPAGYVIAVRDFIKEHTNLALRSMASAPVQEQMQMEAERSQAYADEAYGEVSAEALSAEEAEWLGAGFSDLMGRLVKITAKASEGESTMPAFSDLGEDTKDDVRRYVFEEYVDLSQSLSSTGRPVKTVCQSSVFLYRSAESARHFLEDNEDLGRHNVAHLLQQRPMSADSLVEAGRDKIEELVTRFPTIPYSEIRSQVLRRPASYEQSLRKYAAKKGLVLELDESEPPEAEGLFQSLRQLLRDRVYDARHITPPQELVEAARMLGKEAVARMDESEYTLPGADKEADSELQGSFEEKIEQLVVVGGTAWRHGDLPVTLERMPSDFRQAFYERVLGDFLQIHEELGGKSIAENPVLFYDPAEVRQLVEAHPRIPMIFLKRLMIRDLDSEGSAFTQFDDSVQMLLAENPRLREHQAMRMTIWNSDAELPSKPEQKGGKPSPREFIGNIRQYLGNPANVNSNLSNNARDEIKDHSVEIEDWFEATGWNFAGIEIPEKAHVAFIKKIEELIGTSERAFREGEIPTRVRDFAPQERAELYGMVAENFAEMTQTLDFHPSSLRRAPVLYMSASELADLRSRYEWLGEGGFRETVKRHVSNVAEALEEIDQLRTEMKPWYPGMGDSIIRRFMITSPAHARQNAMAYIRKTSENQYRIRNSANVEPNPEKPAQIYKHLRTLIKLDRVPRNGHFEKEIEEQITTLRQVASTWLAGKNITAEMDEIASKKLIDHLEYCVRASELLHRENGYPAILKLQPSSQIDFIKSIYDNQSELHELIADSSTVDKPKFRVHTFGFMHDAKYLKALWKQYEAYMPRHLITYAALVSPRRPIDKLNELVEHRVELLIANPELNQANISKALADKLKN